MANPMNDGYFHLTGTAAGTTSVMNRSGNFNTIIVGTVTTGTVLFYDSSGTAQGTAASTLLTSITGAVNSFWPQVFVHNGILAVQVGGTIDCLLGVG